MRKSPDRAVVAWLVRNDRAIALSTVVIAEIAYGIEKIRTDERSPRLAAGLHAWRERCRHRIRPFDETAALLYCSIMGTAVRSGAPMHAVDGMIAAIAQRNGGALATRNVADFRTTGLTLIDPWAER